MIRNSNINIPKEITWDIIRSVMLSYEGAEPKNYGFDAEVSAIGKKLADALYDRVERLIQHYKAAGILEGGEKYVDLKWVVKE